MGPRAGLDVIDKIQLFANAGIRTLDLQVLSLVAMCTSPFQMIIMMIM